MSPSLSRSTLFPYTTLFRSIKLHLDAYLLLIPFSYLYVEGQPIQSTDFFETLNNFASNFNLLRTSSGLIRAPDRKSTRLNSSHLVISYAVFCLKKKKNTNFK